MITSDQARTIADTVRAEIEFWMDGTNRATQRACDSIIESDDMEVVLLLDEAAGDIAEMAAIARWW